MLKHIVIWFFKSVLTFVITIPVIVLGLPMVALALPFAQVDTASVKPFTQYPEQGNWSLLRLPKWALLWDNPYDGFFGDKRGWWANKCALSGRVFTDFISCWLWGAVRNPANYWSRNIVGIDVSECVIIKLAGQDYVEADMGFPGWQFLMATTESGKHYHRFFLEIPWSFSPEHILLIDIGWKIKLSHNGTAKTAEINDRNKGSVFTISLWKSL